MGALQGTPRQRPAEGHQPRAMLRLLGNPRSHPHPAPLGTAGGTAAPAAQWPERRRRSTGGAGTCRNLPVEEARATEGVWPKERGHQGPPARCPWSSQARPDRPAPGAGSGSRHRPTLPHVCSAHGHPTDSRGGAGARAGSSPPPPPRKPLPSPPPRAPGVLHPTGTGVGGPGRRSPPQGQTGAPGAAASPPGCPPPNCPQCRCRGACPGPSRREGNSWRSPACLTAAATEGVRARRPRARAGGFSSAGKEVILVSL